MAAVNPMHRTRSSNREAPDQAIPGLRHLLAAGRGDAEAFAAFYDEMSGLVFGTCRRVLRDAAMAEEVAQEVFLEVWKVAPTYDQRKGSPTGWVATIAHRRAIDRVRSEESRRRRDDKAGRDAPTLVDGPAEIVEAVAEHQGVRAALEQLTDKQREAVSLAYFGGHTYREVAVLLNVPEGTAKTRIRDGLKRLRDELGVTS